MMFDYEKIYRKSVYKENVEEYTNTWKDAITMKRIYELIPHIDNIRDNTLEELQVEWQAYDKNTYTNFVNSLLCSFDGYETLRLFHMMYKAYKERDNRKFTMAVECLQVHLRLYPTLVGFFPHNLMLFLNLLKKKDNPYTPNIIFVSTKKHKIVCNECQLSKNINYVKCLCSKIFLCTGCQNKTNLKCSICNFNYSIKS
ncbi:MAG: hypothetical protein CMH46_00140 [Muricauda sp.]|nr:hypothetical protein [Allomuricauda sp.]